MSSISRHPIFAAAITLVLAGSSVYAYAKTDEKDQELS